MKRDYGLYIEDMLEAIEKIAEYTSGLDLEQFMTDKKTMDAVIRNFTIIGEAAKHIPPEVRIRYGDVPWKEMAEDDPDRICSWSQSKLTSCRYSQCI